MLTFYEEILIGGTKLIRIRILSNMHSYIELLIMMYILLLLEEIEIELKQ